MPATVTFCPSANRTGPSSLAKSSMISWIGTAPPRWAVGRQSVMGWPERYSPVVSFSICIRSVAEYSGMSGRWILAASCS